MYNDVIGHLGVEKTAQKLQSTDQRWKHSIVERENKEVNRHLRAIVFHRKIKSQWYKLLALVQRIMNAQVHKSLGVSPAQIVFGRSINLDQGLIPTALSEINLVTGMTEYVTDLIQAQSDIIKIAQENQLDYHLAKGEGNYRIPS